MEAAYWSRMLGRRVGRRRALSAASALLGSAAFLAACGDDESPNTSRQSSTTSSSTGSSEQAQLIDSPDDTTAQAKPGGTIKHWADGDPVHFDALASNANGVVNWASAFAYPRMLRFQTPVYPKLGDGTLEGEVAAEHEISGDRLTITFKLRPGMKWDAREPTNGRVIDAEDVLFSWNKFVELNQSAGNMSALRSPSAAVESLTAPDNETIVVKLKQPDATLLSLFASWDHFYVMPRESDGGFDPRQVIRGHGPWILEEYIPSTRLVWAKNPDYFQQGFPYPDKLERPIIGEYTTRLAQFKAGNIYTNVALANDIIQTHSDLPETSIREAAAFTTSIWHGLSFGYKDDSPFKDARVRQAASMLVDGDGYVDVIDNREAFREAGMEIDTASNTIVAAGWGDYWLDPQDTAKFGENAKYLQYNVEEAKQLLSAAGYPDGFDFDMYFSTSLYGPVYLQSVELVSGMLNGGGLRATLQGLPYEQFKDIYYEAYYGPSYASGKTSGFKGMVHLANPPLPTVTSHLFTFVHKDGGRFHGLTPDGNNAHLGDPKLNADIDKLKGEFDREAQVAMVHDISRYFTGQSYYVPRKAQTKLVSVIWPALANFDVFQQSPGQNQWTESNLHWWIDETKAPLA